MEQLANAGPHSPGPRAPWRSGPADGPPLPPALQREASLCHDQALAWARFSYQQLRLLGVDPLQAAQVLPPALRAPWTAVGSLYAWGRGCQACTAPTTPAELYRLITQVAAALAAHFPLAWPELCAALAAPAGPPRGVPLPSPHPVEPPMDSLTYLTESARTASGQFHPDRVTPTHLHDTLQTAIASGAAADAVSHPRP